MLVEAAGRLMIPIAIVLASSLILLILDIIFGSIRAALWVVLLALRGILFGVFVILYWVVRLLRNGIRAIWFRLTS